MLEVFGPVPYIVYIFVSSLMSSHPQHRSGCRGSVLPAICNTQSMPHQAVCTSIISLPMGEDAAKLPGKIPVGAIKMSLVDSARTSPCFKKIRCSSMLGAQKGFTLCVLWHHVIYIWHIPKVAGGGAKRSLHYKGEPSKSEASYTNEDTGISCISDLPHNTASKCPWHLYVTIPNANDPEIHRIYWCYCIFPLNA